jgi:hypothetical protein
LPEAAVADHIELKANMEENDPSKYRKPAPKAVKPLLLSAPLLGGSQCAVPVSFNFPPA